MDSSIFLDTFDGPKPRFSNRGERRRSVSTLSIFWASGRGVEWVDLTDNYLFSIRMSVRCAVILKALTTESSIRAESSNAEL